MRWQCPFSSISTFPGPRGESIVANVANAALLLAVEALFDKSFSILGLKKGVPSSSDSSLPKDEDSHCHTKNYGLTMERKKIIFEVDNKRFEVKFEGFNGGTWVSLVEKSRGRISSVGFEREEVAWIQEQLKKVVDLKAHLGFKGKYRGKTKTHLLEICFNEKGRFIEIMEFAINKKKLPCGSS